MLQPVSSWQPWRLQELNGTWGDYKSKRSKLNARGTALQFDFRLMNGLICAFN